MLLCEKPSIGSRRRGVPMETIPTAGGTALLRHSPSPLARSHGRATDPIVDIGTAAIPKETEDFSGLWVSEGGSLYSFDGSQFVCEAVHSHEYRGWVGKIAVGQVSRIGSSGSGMQAFRNRTTGALSNWVPIVLIFKDNVITKLFPGQVSSDVLVYGHIERYFRQPAHRLDS